jgi:putative hydrolase of the HAD superfamily
VCGVGSTEPQESSGVGSTEPRGRSGVGPTEPPGIRAVIFDLWETLVDWNPEAAAEMVASIASRSGVPPEEFHRRWDTAENPRYVGPIRDALRSVGVAEEALEEICAVRLDYSRRALVPRKRVVETLRTLRERGFRIGLITVCSEEVELLFPDSSLSGLFDAEVFSNAVALAKPDPRIYLHCCELLGVAPGEAVFVGDGANDELEGARRVGMEAILIHRPGEDPPWPGLADWNGLRVTSIPEVLEALKLLHA